MEYTGILLLVLIAVVLIWVWGSCSQKSRFVFSNADYQYGNPNLGREYHYYKCLADECNGNTHDYECLEKCHLKAYRRGMKEPDVKDMVCMKYRDDEHAYYRCLDSVYADYRYP